MHAACEKQRKKGQTTYMSRLVNCGKQGQSRPNEVEGFPGVVPGEVTFRRCLRPPDLRVAPHDCTARYCRIEETLVGEGRA